MNPTHPNGPATEQDLGALLASGRLVQAREALDAAVAREPRSQPLRMLRALANFRLKAYDAAARDFVEARALEPRDPEAWLGEGLCLAMRQEIPPALSTLESMLEAHPGFIRGRLQTARLYFKLCLTNKGREHLAAALAADPGTEDRAAIAAMLKEQEILDGRRMLRPDFVALNRRPAGA